MQIKYTVIFPTILFLLNACNTTKPFYSKEEIDWKAVSPSPNIGLSHTVFLVGDAGEDPEQSAPVMNLLKTELAQLGERATVVFLGDNIYPSGLPESGADDREMAQKRISAQMEAVKQHLGKIIFVPGNHDWAKGHEGGLETVIREEQFVEKYLNRGDIFIPSNGCPVAEPIHLTNDITLIALNTQWWLHPYEKPSDETVCSMNSRVSGANAIEHAAQQLDDKTLIFVGHHPIYSNGNHGGYFPFIEHIFPLTAINRALIIPLPVIGSIYPLGRKFIGNIQDLAHPKYKAFRKELLSVFKGHNNMIYAAGHEHNLQYFNKGSQHHIVSGSGSKTTWVAKRHGASFTQARKGLVKLLFYDNQEVWMEVLVTGNKLTPEETKENNPGDVVYRKRLIMSSPN